MYKKKWNQFSMSYDCSEFTATCLENEEQYLLKNKNNSTINPEIIMASISLTLKDFHLTDIFHFYASNACDDLWIDTTKFSSKFMPSDIVDPKYRHRFSIKPRECTFIENDIPESKDRLYNRILIPVLENVNKEQNDDIKNLNKINKVKYSSLIIHTESVDDFLLNYPVEIDENYKDNFNNLFFKIGKYVYETKDNRQYEINAYAYNSSLIPKNVGYLIPFNNVGFKPNFLINPTVVYTIYVPLVYSINIFSIDAPKHHTTDDLVLWNLKNIAICKL